MRRKRVPILPMRSKDVARFWSHVEKSVDGCWLWKGPVNTGGYGLFRVYWPDTRKRRGYFIESLLAHRVSWSLTKGAEIHEDLVMRHRCHTPRCVNPAHLRTGTMLDNYHDMERAGRKPAHGAWLGIVQENHPASKYSKEVREKAIALMFGDPPMLLLDVAKLLGCSNKTVGRWRAEYLRSGAYLWCRPKI